MTLILERPGISSDRVAKNSELSVRREREFRSGLPFRNRSVSRE